MVRGGGVQVESKVRLSLGRDWAVQFTWALRSSLQQAAEPEDNCPLVLLHHLEADAEGEGEGGDDDEPGDAG